MPEIGADLSFSKDIAEELNGRLIDAREKGATYLLVNNSVQLIQHLMLRRYGAWRRSNVIPILASGLAFRSLQQQKRQMVEGK